jgi:hypothetical protein
MRVRSAAGCEAPAAAGKQVADAWEPLTDVKWIGVLRLVLGGHSRTRTDAIDLQLQSRPRGIGAFNLSQIQFGRHYQVTVGVRWDGTLHEFN